MKKLVLIICGFVLALALPSTVSAQTITGQPQSLTVNNASTAEFTVVASNALSYQWQFNGTNLSDVNYISGARGPTLTLADVNSNQAGSYTVVVNLNGSSVTSQPPALLTIVPGTIVTFTFSGFPDGSTSNVDVKLFDHDKPATVENFIHYIRSGAFSNMFFERCLPGFILQGGDYGATDQPNPPFPPQVDSEFNDGPLIHNTFGSLAMALLAGNQDSATSGFFFNLADNS